MPKFKTKPGAINHETFLKIDRISIQKVKVLLISRLENSDQKGSDSFFDDLIS